MAGGGTESEAELAVARLRMRLEQEIGPAATQRLLEEEGRETFDGRLLALAVVGVAWVLLEVFF